MIPDEQTKHNRKLTSSPQNSCAGSGLGAELVAPRRLPSGHE